MQIDETEEFTLWRLGLRDKVAKARVRARLDLLKEGHFGDCDSVGEGVLELRIFHGPGYRLYCVRTGKTVVLMVGGGDKASQVRDIERAKAVAKQLKGVK